MPCVCVCPAYNVCVTSAQVGAGYTVNTCRRSKSVVPCAYSLNRFNGLSEESPRKNAWYPLQSAISFLYALQTKKRRPIPISHAPPIKGSAIFFLSLLCGFFFLFLLDFSCFFIFRSGCFSRFIFPLSPPPFFTVGRQTQTKRKENHR